MFTVWVDVYDHRHLSEKNYNRFFYKKTKTQTGAAEGLLLDDKWNEKKQERLKDYLMMEEEYVSNQEALKPKEDSTENEERNKLDELRGTPMDVGTLEVYYIYLE